MMFLIRTAFWVSILLLALPLGGGGAGSGTAEGPDAQDRASIDALSALAAAGATVSDMRDFCARQPGACEVGSQALGILSERARNGAALIQDYLGGDADGRAQGATPAANGAESAPVSRDTLTPADRKPAWRGPAPDRAA